MDRAYANRVSRRQWQIGLFAFALTVIVGATLAAALLAGAANPPYAAHMTEISPGILWHTSSVASSLKHLSPPLTLETEVSVSGAPELGWGIWVSSGVVRYEFRIREDGYFNIGSGWQQFMHIRPESNKLTLHITSDDQPEDLPSDYEATLRINNEIAWQGTLQPSLNEWGFIPSKGGSMMWKAIKIYTG